MSSDVVSSLFDKLRQKELEGDADDLTLLTDLAMAIQARDGFILGSFVYSKRGADPDARGFWPESSPPIFFHADYSGNKSFIEQVTQTFNILNEKKLFISALIHDLDEKRAKRVELVHKTDNNCLNDIHQGECAVSDCRKHNHSMWAIKNTLENLKNVFTSPVKENVELYSNVINGYFPNKDDNYLVVYCPFLVPDGKPPGNFFGVFKCNDRCQELLPYLSNIQLAGTLIFARMAVETIVNSRLHEKYAAIEKRMEELRSIQKAIKGIDTVIDGIGSIVNPYNAWIGDSEMQNLKQEFANLLGGDCHKITDWGDKGECMQKFLFALSKTEALPRLKGLLVQVPPDLYGSLFGVLDEKDNYKNKACLIKALTKEECCPGPWLNLVFKELEVFNRYDRGLGLNNEIPQLVFFRALKGLFEQPDVKVVPSLDGSELIITCTITSNEDKGGDQGLEILKGSIEKKAVDIASARPHDGQTATFVAILAAAAQSRVGGDGSPIPAVTCGAIKNGETQKKLEYIFNYSIKSID